MKIGIIKTFPELETLRAYWEKWQFHPNNDFDQFKMICQLRSEVECPCVTVIENNGEPLALLAGRLERTQFAPSIGYLKPVRLSAKVITVIHQGLLGPLDEQSAMKIVQYLWSLLGSGEADAIEFHYLSEGSTLLQALTMYGSRWFCEKKPRWSVHWEMALPAEGRFIELKVRSKHRSSIRKKLRELESAFPGRVSWRWVSSFDDIPELCTRLEELATRTYQRGLGSGFIDGTEYRERFVLFARRGQLRVQLLEIDGRIRAFWFGFVYDNVFHLSETGYDPDLRRYEVGTLIFIRIADELIGEGVRKLDFGLGDALYKRRFGDQSWQEATIWLFAPTGKGIVLRTILRLSLMLDSTGRRILQRIRLVDRLKTVWRRNLVKSSAEIDKLEN